MVAHIMPVSLPENASILEPVVDCFLPIPHTLLHELRLLWIGEASSKC